MSGQEETSYQTPSKQYRIPPSTPDAFMVEDAQWTRVRRRVKELEELPSLDIFLTSGSTALSIGIGATVAVLVLPGSEGTTLGDGVEPALWAIGIGSSALGLVLAGLYVWMRRVKANAANDICDEMDTIHQAWEQRESES